MFFSRSFKYILFEIYRRSFHLTFLRSHFRTLLLLLLLLQPQAIYAARYFAFFFIFFWYGWFTEAVTKLKCFCRVCVGEWAGGCFNTPWQEPARYASDLASYSVTHKVLEENGLRTVLLGKKVDFAQFYGCEIKSDFPPAKRERERRRKKEIAARPKICNFWVLQEDLS